MTVAIPGSTPTSTTHADTNVEGTSAVKIKPNQAESETLLLAAEAPRSFSDPDTFNLLEILLQSCGGRKHGKAGDTLIHPTPPLTLTNECAPLNSSGMRSKGHIESESSSLTRRKAKDFLPLSSAIP